jgi:hypothetical protein
MRTICTVPVGVGIRPMPGILDRGRPKNGAPLKADVMSVPGGNASKGAAQMEEAFHPPPVRPAVARITCFVPGECRSPAATCLFSASVSSTATRTSPRPATAPKWGCGCRQLLCRASHARVRRGCEQSYGRRERRGRQTPSSQGRAPSREGSGRRFPDPRAASIMELLHAGSVSPATRTL